MQPMALPMSDDQLSPIIKKKAELASERKVKVNVSITNQTPGELHLQWLDELHGHGKFPNIIAPGDDARFVHLENEPHSGGSKALVGYSGINQVGLENDNCKWIVAWEVNESTPDNPSPLNKVSVVCGPLYQHGDDQVNWDSIRGNIRDDSPNQSTYIDEATGTMASATLDKESYPADLHATFGLAPLN